MRRRFWYFLFVFYTIQFAYKAAPKCRVPGDCMRAASKSCWRFTRRTGGSQEEPVVQYEPMNGTHA
jgi:hypothetical protein